MNRENDVLILGHYCHDTLIHSDHCEPTRALGGSAAYISSVFAALDIPFKVVTKVGEDFAYHSQVKAKASVAQGFSTTQFIADFRTGERMGRVQALCDRIRAEDLPAFTGQRYKIGLAVGIVGEVTPDALIELSNQSDFVICDVQGLIRDIGRDGLVKMRNLHESEFNGLLGKIQFLKANREEAQHFDLMKVSETTCVLMTDGEKGCQVFFQREHHKVSAFTAKEVDPTGAGDSFLAGFSLGILRGMTLLESVRLGNLLGSLAVRYVGVPPWQKILNFKESSSVLETSYV